MKDVKMWRTLLVVFSLLVSSVVLAAEEKSEGNDAVGVSTKLFLERVGQAQEGGSNRSFGYTSVEAEFEWQFLTFEIDHRMYDWEMATYTESSLGNEPWEKLTRIAPGVQYFTELSGEWSVWAKFMAYSGFEDEMSADSWTYSPQVVGFYHPELPLTLYGGLGIRYHSVDAVVYPIFGVVWGVNSKKGFSGNVGFPDTEVRYGLTEKTAIKCTFEWDIRVYRLSNDSDLAPEGYLRVEDIIPGVQITYEPVNGLTVYVGVRGYFRRQLTVFNQDEHEMDEDDVEDSWASILGFDYSF